MQLSTGCWEALAARHLFKKLSYRLKTSEESTSLKWKMNKWIFIFHISPCLLYLPFPILCSTEMGAFLVFFSNHIWLLLQLSKDCMCLHVQSVTSDSAAPWAVAHQAPLFMEFSREEYWNRLPFPTPGYPPDPGIEPASLESSALAGRFFTSWATKPMFWKGPAYLPSKSCPGCLFIHVLPLWLLGLWDSHSTIS